MDERSVLCAEEESVQKPKKKGWGIFGWQFKKEIGLISITNPPEEELTVFTLNNCIDTALKNHLPLQTAEKSIKLAEMRIFESRRNMLPSATVAYEESSGRIQSRAYIGRKQYIEGQQPIFRGWELYYTMKQSEVNLQIVKNDYDRVKNEVILQVKKAYYSLKKAKENLKMQMALAKEVDAICEMVKKGSDDGAIAKLEYLNVASQASQIHYQLASAEGDEAVAELILKQAMNVEPRENVRIEEGLEFTKVKVDYDLALHAAFMNRPEIKINSLMIDYYNHGKRIAKAKGWPKIDLLGQWGLSKEEYAPDDLANDPDRKMEQQWYAGVKASMPFWGSTGEYAWTKEKWQPVVSAYQGTESVTSSYKLKVLDKMEYFSDKLLSEIDFDKARQELIKTKQDVVLEIREGCFGYEKALLQLKTASSKVLYQEKDTELTKMKRGMDEVQDSNMIESMIKLAQEKFGYIQALADCHMSLAGLNKAIGLPDYYKDEPVSNQK